MNNQNENKKLNFFEAYPKLAGISLTLITIFMVDLIAALVLIKENDRALNEYAIRQTHPYFHHGLRPNVKGKSIWGDRIHPININSIGGKDDSVKTITRQSNKPRTVFLGDSFVEGIGVAYENTFVGLVDRHYPDLDILNAGVVSYSPKLYHLKAKYLLEVIQLKIDHLFVFIDISDIQDEVIYQDFAPTAASLSNLDHLKSGLRKYLLGYSFFYNFYFKNKYYRLTEEQQLADRERGLWATDSTIYEKWGREGIERAVEHMDQLYKLCQKHQVKLTLAIHPWPLHLEKRALHNQQVETWEEFARERQVRLLNLFPVFINDSAEKNIEKYFISGDIHWNEKGHKKIADIIINEGFLVE